MSGYKYLTYEEIVDGLLALAKTHPKICKVYTAQERYGLPHAGECGEEKCKQWVVAVGNIERHTRFTPEVFFSGALHGNERIGPNAVYHLVQYLVASYGKVPFVTRMVDTRLTVAMPMPNAWGYHRSRRDELGMDPNRDFAFDTSPTSCMQTIAARSVNEVWQAHLFQLGVTFHGGDNLIGYPWGDFSHCRRSDESKARHREECDSGYVAADKVAMEALGKFMVEVSGSYRDTGNYRLGEMNKVIYAVHGGMEDWAYGGSWHNAKTTCSPTTYGGYRADRTTYSDSTLRALLFLVETADDKIPPSNTLGKVQGGEGETSAPFDFLSHGAGGKLDGHIPRNLRLSLAVLDGAEPYVNIQHVRRPEGVRASSAAGVSVTILAHAVLHGIEALEKVEVECLPAGVACAVERVNKSSWAPWGKLGKDLFSVSITANYSRRLNAKNLKVRIGVNGDSSWRSIPSKASERDKHQLHWVHSRVDPSYLVEKGGKAIAGKSVWWSSVVHVPLVAGDASKRETAAPNRSMPPKLLSMLQPLVDSGERVPPPRPPVPAHMLRSEPFAGNDLQKGVSLERVVANDDPLSPYYVFFAIQCCFVFAVVFRRRRLRS